VLGDGAGVDPAGAGEPDAAFVQLVARELVSAGADRLDEAQPLGLVEQLVAPQPEMTSTSASAMRFCSVSGSRTAKLSIAVPSAENRSCSR